MIATANAKSIEEIKSFLSRQKETYKVPYETHPADRLRQCVFGGTTNRQDFFARDRTGNRRFLPVTVYPERAEVHILDDEAAARAYIEQMWAEAMTVYRSGKYKLSFSMEMNRYLNAHQQAWTIAQVKSILKEETYIGHSVHNKQSNISFKNKKKVRKPQEEWYRVENTHEAIISEEVFQKVQELIASRRRRQKNGTTQIFSGLVKCADCGWSLAYGVNSQNKNPYAHYHCSKYGQGLRQCSMHYIRYDVLYAYVLARLQYWSMMIQKDEDKLLKRLLNASDRERNSAKKKQAAELKKAEKRKAEVDGLFAKMYEDWSAGRITEYNFNMLSEKYQNEQKELETKIRQLHETMEAAVQKAVKGEDGSREQEVEIFYRFIGKID